jgi:hypothetical protein
MNPKCNIMMMLYVLLQRKKEETKSAKRKIEGNPQGVQFLKNDKIRKGANH